MPNLALRFRARREEGNLEEQFLASGGELGAAAGRDETDFGVTYGEHAVSSFVTSASSDVVIPLPEKAYTIDVDTARVSISSRTRINLTTSRVGAGINGTLVTTMAGQASVPMHELLGAVSKSPFCQISATYPAWPEASAVIGAYGAVIFDLDDGHEYDVDVVVDPDADAAIASTQEIVKGIYDSSWKVRDAIVYAPSPNLTKSVMRVPFGIDGSGFSLSAQVNDRKFPFCAESLESMLSVCVGMEIGNDPEKTSAFLSSLAVPSPSAVAKHGKTVSSALSTLACFLTPYRVDGRAVVLPTGTQMVSAESWLAEAPRTAIQAGAWTPVSRSASKPSYFVKRVGAAVGGSEPPPGASGVDSLPSPAPVSRSASKPSHFGQRVGAAVGGSEPPPGASRLDSLPSPDPVSRCTSTLAYTRTDDCDGSAALVVSAIEFAKATSSREKGVFPFIDALASVSEFYVSGVSVLGATAGHADAADQTASQVAGHAVAIMLPKTSLLAALQRGEERGTPVRPASDTSVQQGVHAARFASLFPASFLASIPEAERGDFASTEALARSAWSDPVSGFQPFACEGTTPASSRMYVHDREKREENRVHANLDEKVLAYISPNIARSIKMLESGNTGAHRFYSAFVELTLPTSCPLFTSKDLREYGAATAHLVLSPDPAKGHSGPAPVSSTAGASPKDLCTGAFSATPLWRTDASDGPLLDKAIFEANSNQLPPRKRPMRLNPVQTSNLKKSMSKIFDLQTTLSNRGERNQRQHSTQHIFSYACLVNNPESVSEFAKTIASNTAISGSVEIQKVDSIAEFEDGQSAGIFALVDLSFPI